MFILDSDLIITDGPLYIPDFALCILAISADVHTLQHIACILSREEQDNCTHSLN